MLYGLLVAWSARKQTIVILSTAKAKYIALASVVYEVLYL